MTIKEIIKFQSIKSLLSSVFIASSVLILSSCVSQNFENETPVVENQANRNDIAATRISLALGYLKMGNMSQAKLNLEKAKSFAPKLVQVHTAFAHYYEAVGEHKLTIKSYETALSIKKNDADTLNNYGVYLCRQGKVDAAEKQFLKAIAVPSYLLVSKTYANLSSCYLQVDNFTKAEIYLNKAILHNPSSAATLLEMVHLQYAMSKYAQAKVYLQRFEKVTRRFTSKSLALAYKVYLKLNNKKIAKNYSALLVKMHPKSWESTQFLLNGLELIDSDNLAKRFQLTQMGSSIAATTPPKRVIKLSPNKKQTEQKSKVEKVENSISPAEISTKRTIVLTAPKIIAKTKVDIKQPNDADKDKNLAEISKVENFKVKASDTQDLGKTSAFNQNVEDAVQQEVSNVKVTEEASNKMRKFEPKLHLVLKGESFFSISIKYNIKISALKRWNKKLAKRGLRIADKLHLVNPAKVSR